MLFTARLEAAPSQNEARELEFFPWRPLFERGIRAYFDSSRIFVPISESRFLTGLSDRFGMTEREGACGSTEVVPFPVSSRSARAPIPRLYNQAWVLPHLQFRSFYLECDSLSSHMPHQHGQATPQGPQPLPGVDAIIAVGSGKGGVGKTTLAVNLAVALVKMGHKAGLLDADVYGPNVPLMLGVNEQPRMVGENRIEPLQAFGLKGISVGFLNPGDKPIIW